jgi:hypothetical protein
VPLVVAPGLLPRSSESPDATVLTTAAARGWRSLLVGLLAWVSVVQAYSLSFRGTTRTARWTSVCASTNCQQLPCVR